MAPELHLGPQPIRLLLDPVSYKSRIEINGYDVSRFVQGFVLRGDPHQGTTLEVRLFFNKDIEMEGVADIWAEVRTPKMVDP